MNPSDREALRRHLEALNLYGRDLKHKDVQSLVTALNNAGERHLADTIIGLDHFTTVNAFIRQNLG